MNKNKSSTSNPLMKSNEKLPEMSPHAYTFVVMQYRQHSVNVTPKNHLSESTEINTAEWE